MLGPLVLYTTCAGLKCDNGYTMLQVYLRLCYHRRNRRYCIKIPGPCLEPWRYDADWCVPGVDFWLASAVDRVESRE